MNLKPFPVLQTARLNLRELSIADEEAFHEIAQYGSGQFASQSMQKIVDFLRRDFDKGNSINWALDLEGNLIGTCGYYRGFAKRQGEVGFVMKEAYRQKGFMTETISRVIDFGFNDLGLQSVIACTRDENKNAIALLQKIGFTALHEMDGDYRKYILHKR